MTARDWLFWIAAGLFAVGVISALFFPFEGNFLLFTASVVIYVGLVVTHLISGWRRYR